MNHNQSSTSKLSPCQPESFRADGVRLTQPFTVMGISYAPIALGVGEIHTSGDNFLTLSREEAWLFLRLTEILCIAQKGVNAEVLLCLFMRLLGDINKSNQVIASEMKKVCPTNNARHKNATSGNQE